MKRFARMFRNGAAEDTCKCESLYHAVMSNVRSSLGGSFRICSKVETATGLRVILRPNDNVGCQRLLTVMPLHLCGVKARIEESDMDGSEEVCVYISHLRHVWVQANSTWCIRFLRVLLNTACGLLLCASCVLLADNELQTAVNDLNCSQIAIRLQGYVA